MKVKMLVTCEASIGICKTQIFEKGKEYKVNDFLFNTFTTTKRAVSLESEELEIEEDDIDESEKIAKLKETHEQEIAKLQKRIEELEKEKEKDEDDEGTQEVVDLNNMSKEQLKEHCKKIGVILQGNPSEATIINKINEVKND